MPSGMVATFSITEGTFGTWNPQKQSFPVYTEKHCKTWENPQKRHLSDFKLYFIRPIITSSLPLVAIALSTVDLWDLWSNGHHAFSGGLGVRGLPTQKGGFLVPPLSHASFILWDWAEPTQNHLLLEPHLKSTFTELKLYRLCLNSPFGSGLYHPIQISFVFIKIH